MNEPKRSLADLFAGQTDARRAEDEARPDFSAGAAALFERIAAESAREREAAAPAPRRGAAPSVSPPESSPQEQVRRTRRTVETCPDAAPEPMPVISQPDIPASAAAGPGRRRLSRLTLWLVVAAVVLAIAVVVALLTLQALETTEGASPAAMEELEASESALADAVAELDAGLIRVGANRDEAVALADRADTALADITGFSDETARTAASAAVATYRAGLEGLDLPEAPEPQEAPSADPVTEDAVDARQDGVRAQQEIVDGLLAELAAAEQELQRVETEFAGAWKAFFAAFPAHAVTVGGENAEAEEAFRTALTAAAQAVAAATAGDLPGEPELDAYVAAVVALRADQDRAVAEARTQERSSPPEQPTPVDPEPAPSDPPVEPTPEPTPDPTP